MNRGRPVSLIPAVGCGRGSGEPAELRERRATATEEAREHQPGPKAAKSTRKHRSVPRVTAPDSRPAAPLVLPSSGHQPGMLQPSPRCLAGSLAGAVALQF